MTHQHAGTDAVLEIEIHNLYNGTECADMETLERRLAKDGYPALICSKGL